MKIAITGATGVIGAALAERLSAEHDVIKVARGTLPPEDVDVLICAHGTLGKNWQEPIVVNLMYTMNCVYRVLDPKRIHPKHIVLLGGAGIGGENIDENAAYAASKGGLVAFVESLAKTNPKVSINVVAPGPLRSKMNPKANNGPGNCADLIDWLVKSGPGSVSGRLLSAVHDEWWEIANYSAEHADDYKLRRWMHW